MKVNYSIELEPQETEAICKCLTDIFGIYADAETKGSIPAKLTQELITKISNLPQQKEEEKAAPVVKKAAPAKKAERDFREEK